MEELGKITLGIGILILSILLTGLIVDCYYEWFLMKVFNLPNISYTQSIGLGFFISLFHFYKKDKEEKEMEIIAKEFFTSAFIKLVGLGIAYLFYIIIF